MQQDSEKPVITITMPGYPKPNLWLLMLRHGLQLPTLAKESRQDPLILWSMIIGHPVKPEQVSQVLGVINERTGTAYQLESIAVNLEVQRESQA